MPAPYTDISDPAQTLLAYLKHANGPTLLDNYTDDFADNKFRDELSTFGMTHYQVDKDPGGRGHLLTAFGHRAANEMIGDPRYIEFNNTLEELRGASVAAAPTPAVGDVYNGPQGITDLPPGSVLVHTAPDRSPYRTRVYERSIEGHAFCCAGIDEIYQAVDLTYPVTLVHLAHPESTLQKLERLEKVFDAIRNEVSKPTLHTANDRLIAILNGDTPA